MDVGQVNLSSLIENDELKCLFRDFTDMTGFTIGLVDVVTNELLLGGEWRDICSKFHRAHPESEAHCIGSNKRLTVGLKRVGEIRIEHCQNGLVDAGTPIIVQEKHLANLLTGQILFSPPDLERFKSQAQKFGYDEQRYLESLAEVPVVDEKRVSSFLRYLAKKISFIAQKNLDFLHNHSESMKYKDLLQRIAKLAPVGIGVAHKRTIQWTNRAMSQITGYSNDELTGLKGETLYPDFAAFTSSGGNINKQFRDKGIALREVQWKTKDGSLIDVYVSSAPLDDDIFSGKTIFTVLDISKHVKDEKLLMQSEECLTLALDAANLGLWDWKIQMDEVFFNDNYFNMLGYESGTFPQNLESWKMLLHPEDQKKSVNTLLSTLSTTDPSWNTEFRMLSATGDYQWILGQGKVFEFTQSGMPIRATGIHQDITQQKCDEENLRDKEQKYRELFNKMSSGVAIYKAVGNGKNFIIEDMNNAALEATGISLREAFGKEVSDVFPDIDSLGLLDIFKRVYKTGIAEELLGRQYKDEARVFWADIYIYKLSSGLIVTIYNDFTEKKEAEISLEKQRIQLEQIIELATDAFFLGDHEGTLITVNQQATVLSGYSCEELLSQKLTALFLKEELKESPFNFTLLKKGGVLMEERNLLHKNGTIIPIEMHSKMMPDGTFQSFVRDITKRKKSASALLKSQHDLELKQLQLKETNTALKVLIKQAGLEKIEIEESVAANLLTLVEPHLNRLKRSGINSTQANSIKIIESTLYNLTSPFVRTSIAMNLKLSPAEIQVANLIKQGKTSKQIAELLGLSPQTIDKHRSHIRKKFGVTNKDISLRELLTSRS